MPGTLYREFFFSRRFTKHLPLQQKGRHGRPVKLDTRWNERMNEALAERIFPKRS